MIDERFGKNTKVKMILQRLFREHLELSKKVGSPPELMSEEIKVINCKKRYGYWEADITVIQKYDGGRVPIRYIDRILRREVSDEQR